MLPGDRLPTVRGLADTLGLAPNTVARAYRELEAGGWIVGKGRAGTFVADSLPRRLAAPERDLAKAFGEGYRQYQREVPMLLPLATSKRKSN